VENNQQDQGQDLLTAQGLVKIIGREALQDVVNFVENRLKIEMHSLVHAEQDKVLVYQGRVRAYERLLSDLKSVLR